MTEEEQGPHYEALHDALLDAIQKYETATGWSVIELRLRAKPSVTELNLVVQPPAS